MFLKKYKTAFQLNYDNPMNFFTQKGHKRTKVMGVFFV